MAGSLNSFLPQLPKPDLIQLVIFLFLFTLSSFAMVGNWLGGSYTMNNGTLLLICLFTIVLPPDAKTYYVFSYALFISAILDILTIGFNWGLYYRNIGFLGFFLGFVLAIILVIIKLILFIHQLTIAKQLNKEPPVPVDLNRIFMQLKAGPQTSGQQQQHQQQQQQHHQEQPQSQQQYQSRNADFDSSSVSTPPPYVVTTQVYHHSEHQESQHKTSKTKHGKSSKNEQSSDDRL